MSETGSLRNYEETWSIMPPYAKDAFRAALLNPGMATKVMSEIADYGLPVTLTLDDYDLVVGSQADWDNLKEVVGLTEKTRT